MGSHGVVVVVDGFGGDAGGGRQMQVGISSMFFFLLISLDLIKNKKINKYE